MKDLLIDPKSIPKINENRPHEIAARVRQLKKVIELGVGDIVREWGRLRGPGIYEAPESEQVHSLMNKPKDDADKVCDLLGKAESALEEFASKLRAIDPVIESLREQARLFRNSVQFLPWWNMPPLVAQNFALISAVNSQLARVAQADIECSNAINNSLGLGVNGQGIIGTFFQLAWQSSPWGGGAYGLTTGLIDLGWEFIESVAALSPQLAYNPQTNTLFDYGNYHNNVRGAVNSLGSTLLVAAGGAPLATVTFAENYFNRKTPLTSFVNDRYKEAGNTLTSMVAIDIKSGDPFARWKKDPFRALSYSAGNILTSIPTGGGGAAIKAAGIGGKAVGIGAKAAEFTLGAAVPFGDSIARSGFKGLVKGIDSLPSTKKSLGEGVSVDQSLKVAENVAQDSKAHRPVPREKLDVTAETFNDSNPQRELVTVGGGPDTARAADAMAMHDSAPAARAGNTNTGGGDGGFFSDHGIQNRAGGNERGTLGGHGTSGGDGTSIRTAGDRSTGAGGHPGNGFSPGEGHRGGGDSTPPASGRSADGGRGGADSASPVRDHSADSHRGGGDSASHGNDPQTTRGKSESTPDSQVHQGKESKTGDVKPIDKVESTSSGNQTVSKPALEPDTEKVNSDLEGKAALPEKMHDGIKKIGDGKYHFSKGEEGGFIQIGDQKIHADPPDVYRDRSGRARDSETGYLVRDRALAEFRGRQEPKYIAEVDSTHSEPVEFDITQDKSVGAAYDDFADLAKKRNDRLTEVKKSFDAEIVRNSEFKSSIPDRLKDKNGEFSINKNNTEKARRWVEESFKENKMDAVAYDKIKNSLDEFDKLDEFSDGKKGKVANVSEIMGERGTEATVKDVLNKKYGDDNYEAVIDSSELRGSGTFDQVYAVRKDGKITDIYFVEAKGGHPGQSPTSILDTDRPPLDLNGDPVHQTTGQYIQKILTTDKKVQLFLLEGMEKDGSLRNKLLDGDVKVHSLLGHVDGVSVNGASPKAKLYTMDLGYDKSLSKKEQSQIVWSGALNHESYRPGR